jgi:hypothetical protein
MRRLLLMTALVVAMLSASPALASATPSRGIEHFKIVAVNDQPGSIIARGVFTAGGTDYSRNNKDLFVFPGGAFTAHHPSSEQTVVTQQFNPNTCAFKVVITGPYTLNNGYGAYQGISGSGTYVVTVTGVGPRKANGQCAPNAQPVTQTSTIVASGPVSFK